MVLFVIGAGPSHHGVRLARADQCQRRRDRRWDIPAGNPDCDLAFATVPTGTARLTSSRETPLFAVSLRQHHAATIDAPKSVASLHIRCNTTAILRAKATRAFLNPARLASFIPQLFSGLALRARTNMILAAS